MTAACTAPHCSRELRPHETAGAQQLCDPCIHRARDILRSIPAALVVLHGSLQRERSGDTGRAGTREAPLPCRADVLNLVGPAAVGDIRDPHGDQIGARPIIGVLSDWTRVVLEERAIDGPTVWTEQALSGWLTSQLGWISQQPWASEAVSELRSLDRAIRGILQVDVRTRAVPRPCPTNHCQMMTLSRTDWDRYIRCSNCGGCWTVDELNDDAERRAAA